MFVGFKYFIVYCFYCFIKIRWGCWNKEYRFYKVNIVEIKMKIILCVKDGKLIRYLLDWY